MYDEYLSYDKNGNITALSRNGDLDNDGSTTGAFQIDDLVYTYHPQLKNQLMKVRDMSLVSLGFKDDAADTNDQVDDYGYDANGNMIADTNKNILNIKYNHLNLPVEITFGTRDKIQYLYNAVGQKVQKKVISGGNDTTTEYLDGFQYTNQVLKLFPHAEGYVNVIGVPNDYKFLYVFNYTDHLGNIRVSYGKDPETGVLKILEENHYYPFGLKHTNYNSGKKNYTKSAASESQSRIAIEPVASAAAMPYKYKYQGQERQDELGLNWDSFKWRNYDYAIGRFMSIDPLAEEYAYNSPYAFQENKLGLGRELEGLELVYREGTSPEFKEKFAKTVKFMNEKGTSGQLNQLNEQSKTTLVDNTGNGSYYRPSTDELFWDPTMAVETTNNKILSPATVLGHEIDHALDDKINPTKHSENSKKGSDVKYDTKEEKRVIQGSEQITAKKHGDIKEREVTRTDHSHKNIRDAPDPTSNKNTTIRQSKPIELPEVIIIKSK